MKNLLTKKAAHTLLIIGWVVAMIKIYELGMYLKAVNGF